MTGDLITSLGSICMTDVSGPADMPLSEDKGGSGSLDYRLANGIATIKVPVEAYGHKEVTLGRPC